MFHVPGAGLNLTGLGVWACHVVGVVTPEAH
jgi:hypothetical protein